MTSSFACFVRFSYCPAYVSCAALWQYRGLTSTRLCSSYCSLITADIHFRGITSFTTPAWVWRGPCSKAPTASWYSVSSKH